MLHKFSKVEENLYTFNVDVNMFFLKTYLEDLSIEFSGKEELEFSLENMDLKISDTRVLVKTLDDKIKESPQLDSLVSFLLEVKTPIEFLLFKDQVSNDLFFKVLNEDELSFSYLSYFISQLETKGLVFDLKLVGDSTEGFSAIDCKKYIKFIDFNQFKKEREINKLIESLKSQTTHEPIKIWLEKHYRRYLLQKEHDSNGIYHILDWMNTLTDFSILEKSLSYDRAYAKANQWVIIENQKLGITSTVEKEGVDVETLFEIGGYSMLKLLSSDSKKREGQKMHNCIGTYHLNNGNLYSVRYKGKRVASIDLQNRETREIKGPWNKSVPEDHRLGVRNCLENLGINWKTSSDIKNVGVRVLNVSGFSYIKVVVKETDRLYSTVGSEINFQKIKPEFEASEKDLIIQENLNMFNEDQREEILKILNQVFNSYNLCSLTDCFYADFSYYSRVKGVNKVLEKFPDFKSVWKSKYDEVRNGLKKHSYNDSVLDSLILVLNQMDELDVDKKQINEIVLCANQNGLSSDELRFHPNIYKKFFGVKEKTYKDIFKHVNEYTDLKEISKNRDVLEKILNSKYPALEVENFKRNHSSPETCPHCSLENVAKEMTDSVSEISDLIDDCESRFKENKGLYDSIYSFCEDLLYLIEKLGRIVLLDPSFSVATGEYQKKNLTEYKEFVVDILDFLKEVEQTVGKYKSIEDNIDQFLSNDNEIYENYQKADSLIYELKRFNKEADCPGCSSCDGTDSECEECSGDPIPCSNKDVIESFEDSGVDIDYTFDLISRWSFSTSDEVDFKDLISFYSKLCKINENPKDFLKDISMIFADIS